MSLSRTVFGSEFQMVGAVQRNARFAIVVLMGVNNFPMVIVIPQQLKTQPVVYGVGPSITTPVTVVP